MAWMLYRSNTMVGSAPLKQCTSCVRWCSCAAADYVQRYARPEQLLGHNPVSVNNKSSDDEEGDGDQKMGGDGEESEGAFLSDSDDEA